MYLPKVRFRIPRSEYRLIFGVLVNWFPPKKVTTTKMVAKGDNGSLTMDLFKAIQDFPSKYQYRGMVQYIRQTSVIFNASKPWSTLEPDGEMREEELFENCQIHLAYMGKDQYTTLHRKPFIKSAAPPTVKSMLEPMKLKNTSKRLCQQEPIDLSLPMQRSADSSLELEAEPDATSVDKSQNIEETKDRNSDMLGDNEISLMEISNSVVLEKDKIEITEHDKYKKALDALCKTWSEVKLLQMKASDVEYYMNKNKTPKGDNTVPDPPASPIPCSCFGRPIRKPANAVPTEICDTEDDSDYESDFVKSPRKRKNSNDY